MKKFEVAWAGVIIILWTINWISSKKMKDPVTKLLYFLFSGFATYICGFFIVGGGAEAEVLGLPITSTNQTFEGKYFNPLEVVVTSRRVYVLNDDNRWYSLEGVKIERTDNLYGASRTNKSLVYRRGNELYYGSLTREP